jgi:hypothetical protein
VAGLFRDNNQNITIMPSKRPTSTSKYGDRKRKTSAAARKSGSNMKKTPKKTGYSRTVGSVVKSLHPKRRKK